LDVLYDGLVISELQFLIKKEKFFSAVLISSIFGHQKPGSGSATKLGTFLGQQAFTLLFHVGGGGGGG
jgi:hypothetical protein